MSRLKDGSRNTWNNMRRFAVSAPPNKIELKKIHFFFASFGKIWSRLVRKSKNKKISGLAYDVCSQRLYTYNNRRK